MEVYVVERSITTPDIDWNNGFVFMYVFKNYADAINYAKSWIKDVVGDIADIDLGSVGEYNYVICRRPTKVYAFRVKRTKLVESLD